jgi:hypothetical protein
VSNWEDDTVTAVERAETMQFPELDTVLVGEFWRTRNEARAAARYLRDHGFAATVESSGPPGQRKYRVFVAHPTDAALGAYFFEGDRLDDYTPHWVAT